MLDGYVGKQISLGLKKFNLKYGYMKIKTTLIFEKRIRTDKLSKQCY